MNKGSDATHTMTTTTTTKIGRGPALHSRSLSSNDSSFGKKLSLMFTISTLLLLILYSPTTNAAQLVYSETSAPIATDTKGADRDGDKVGTLLDVTQLLLDGANPRDCREASKVKNLPGLPQGIDAGYSGFFSIDELSGPGKMFWWYFPAQNGNATAPTVIWLQGGPGGSSLYGLFTEMGPFKVNENADGLEANQYSWNNEYAMLFIDNPFGAGFSYADNTKSYVKNEEEVAENLFSLLEQFYTVFPDLQNNELYVTGESYAGHYVPAIAHRIKFGPKGEKNNSRKGMKNNVTVPLTGIAIGDGWVGKFVRI